MLRFLAPLTFLLCASPVLAGAVESACYGKPGNGRLENGVQITRAGANFGPYHNDGVAAGRTFVHGRVARAISGAYEELEQTAPFKFFVYGESGFQQGGKIAPHRTHQNGLAVDFMVPLLDGSGHSVRLPSSAANRYGYGIEFDDEAHYEGMSIDFEAIGDHLIALQRAAKRNGVPMRRVIFEPAYLRKLYATRNGAYLRKNIPFMLGEAWIRHDEHYHVDFEIPCKPL